MRLTRLLPPAAEPVSIEEARYQCKIRHTQADAALNKAIRAARELAEQHTGRALIAQGWAQLEACAPAVIKLGVWPLLAVSKVSVAGTELTLSEYMVYLGDDPKLLPIGAGWVGKAVTVEFTAGYGAAGDDVPAAITNWMLHQIANTIEHSGSVVVGTIVAELKFVDRLLDPYIVPR